MLGSRCNKAERDAEIFTGQCSVCTYVHSLYDFACIFVHLVLLSDPTGRVEAGHGAGIEQIIRQNITFKKAVVKDNGFEFPRARAIASLDCEHSRETIKEFAGWKYDNTSK